MVTQSDELQFYKAFEDEHRGSRSIIKERLRVYEAFVKPLLTLQSPAIVLDLGCGRGEWLELASEWGFISQGVDLNPLMLESVNWPGVSVRNMDAIEALRAAEDCSISALTAFHLVEHLPFDDLRMIIREARRVLIPGGILIIETPNPENIMVATMNFYLDPTHIRPIPPGLLQFTTTYAGFLRNKIVRLQEDQDLMKTRLRLMDVITGPSPDYSVVAQVPAADNVLSLFDHSFSRAYGLQADDVSQSFERGLKDGFNAIVDRAVKIVDKANDDAALARKESNVALQLMDAESRVASANSAAFALSRMLISANGRVSSEEARAREMEESLHRLSKVLEEEASKRLEYSARAIRAELQVKELLGSTSWKLSAPVRWLGRPLRAILRKQARSSKPTAKQRIALTLRNLNARSKDYPALRRVAIAILRTSPSVDIRLRRVIGAGNIHSLARSQTLNPKAQIIFKRILNGHAP